MYDVQRVFFPLSLTFISSVRNQAATDPWVGTWRMDKAKSHFEGFEGYDVGTVQITPEGNNYRFTFTVTGKDGKVEKSVMTQPKRGGNISRLDGTFGNEGAMDT